MTLAIRRGLSNNNQTPKRSPHQFSGRPAPSGSSYPGPPITCWSKSFSVLVRATSYGDMISWVIFTSGFTSP